DAVRLELDVIDKDSVPQRVLAGHEAGAEGAAHRIAGNCVYKVDAFAFEPVECGSVYIGIAVVAGRLRTPLVGQNEEHAQPLAAPAHCPARMKSSFVRLRLAGSAGAAAVLRNVLRVVTVGRLP